MFALRSCSEMIAETRQTTTGLGDCFAIRHIFEAIPRESVDRALSGTDRSKRRDRRFADYLVVYFVILMAWFMELSYLHVFEKLRETLRWLYGDFNELNRLTNSAITQARQRVGLAPLRSLFKLVAKPLATNVTPSAFFRGLRIVLIDGTTF